MNLQHYNITINPSGLTGAAATRYRTTVHEHLRWIERTTSGKLLLNVIRRPDFPVEIRPYPKTECNSSGGSERKTAGAPLTGMVEYSPGEFTSHGSCSLLPADENRGRFPDEILFHELVHVFRTATKRWNQTRAVGYGMRQYDDNEEFIAVLCTNIYISDRTNKIKSGLRAGHEGYGAMSAADAKRFGLYLSSRTAFALVEGFCKDNPLFTKALSDKLPNLTYNPVADYYKFPDFCRALSVIGMMNDREKAIQTLVAKGLSRDAAISLLSVAGKIGAVLH